MNDLVLGLTIILIGFSFYLLDRKINKIEKRIKKLEELKMEQKITKWKSFMNVIIVELNI